MILCAVSLAKGKGILWSWKRVESWASIGAIGFIPSASVKDWGWVEDRGFVVRKDVEENVIYVSRGCGYGIAIRQ